MSITKEELEKYQRADSIGKPLISDEEYDRLMEEYVAEHGEASRPYLRQKQSSAVNDIVGTLDKCYFQPMHPNQIFYQDYLAKHKWDFPICLQPKFDGCSVAVDFTTNKFYTRGDYDGGESMDVTELFINHLPIIKHYAIEGTTAMKFEAIMSDKSFVHIKQAIGKDYRRARDAVSAILTPPFRYTEFAKYIMLIPLRGYANGKQYIPEFLSNISLIVKPENYNSTIDSFVRDILSDGATVTIDTYSYAIDGVVMSRILSCDDDICIVDPMNEAAVKILTNVKETKIHNIKYQFGKQGRITPVAILDPPAEFDTIRVQHVTLSTLQRVVDMNLRINDTVRILYNIVPYLIDSYHDGDYPVPLPENCPICGAKLDYLTYRLVRCSNPECKGLRLGAIIRHAEKMKMTGLGSGVITKLYDNEFVTSIADLYDLRKWDDCIPQTPGFGWQSYDNMIASVDRALSEAPLSRFLGALPFNDTSEKTWKQILTVIPNDELITMMKDGTFPDWIITAGPIPNVGKLKIQKIVDGYLIHKDEITKLFDIVGSTFNDPSNLYDTSPSRGKICMTGTRDEKLTKALTELGYEVGGWSNDCKCVIVPNYNFRSNKTEKAKQKNIPIYDLNDAYTYLVK